MIAIKVMCKKGCLALDAVRRFRDDETGGSASEYALTLALVGASVALGSIALGSGISKMLKSTATCLQSYDRKCHDGIVPVPDSGQQAPAMPSKKP